MALITKTLLAHNLHKFTIELQKAFEDGWRVSPSAVARRSISNRFTVSLQKEVGEKVNAENVKATTEAPTPTPAATETKPETQATTEKPEEAPAKPLTKAQQAKLAKEEAAKLAAENKENEGEAE